MHASVWVLVGGLVLLSAVLVVTLVRVRRAVAELADETDRLERRLSGAGLRASSSELRETLVDLAHR